MQNQVNRISPRILWLAILAIFFPVVLPSQEQLISPPSMAPTNATDKPMPAAPAPIKADVPAPVPVPSPAAPGTSAQPSSPVPKMDMNTQFTGTFEGEGYSDEEEVEGKMPEIQIGSLHDEGQVPLGAGMRLNLKDCLQMALLNNREIKATKYDIDMAAYKLAEAKASGIPVFKYEFLQAPAPRDVSHAVKSFFEGDITFFERGKIEMGLPVYTFGKLELAQDLAKKGVAVESEKRVEKQNDVVLKIKKLYYGILLGEDVRALLQDALKHMNEEVSRRENSTGPTDPAELVRLKLFRFEILKRIGETEKKMALARDGLRLQLGLNRGVAFGLEDDHLRPVPFDISSFEDYLESSQKFRPKSRMVDIGVKTTEDLYKLEKRKIAPDVGFGGYYEFGRTTNSITGLQLTDDFNDPFNFNQAGVGLRISGEINIKGYHSKVKQAEAQYFKAAFGKITADEALALDLKESYLTLLQARKDMENAREAKKIARQYVFITKANLDIGVGDKKEYSDSLQAFLLARARYLESVFDYNLAVADLENKSGGVARQKL